jgi:ABC transporter substrate binding protein
MHAFRLFVDAGGLMSYGATQAEIYTMAAEQVAKILDGARPSELPLRQATRFELVINLRTAKTLVECSPVELDTDGAILPTQEEGPHGRVPPKSRWPAGVHAGVQAPDRPADPEG